MNYYSDYLFHFTGKIHNGESNEICEERGYNNLINIIKNGFKFSGCNVSNRKFQDGLPGIFSMNIEAAMVCFTDIPLHQIKNHTNKYGNFGIGVTKEWALLKQGQPVIYINDSTAFSTLFKNLMQILIIKNPLDSNVKAVIESNGKGAWNDLMMDHQVLYRFLPLLALTETIEHYEEREWRIINTPEINNSKNADIDKSDIKLIILPRKFMNRLHDDLKKIFSAKYSNSDIDFAIIPIEDLDKLTGFEHLGKSK